MCIVALAWQPFSPLPLCLISNRDEFHARPAAALARWDAGPEHPVSGQQVDATCASEHGLQPGTFPPPNLRAIIAGRDLQSGGTWLGITPEGRWAVITNFRDGRTRRQYDTSRGDLVLSFLQSDEEPLAFMQALHTRRHRYAGFNLIVGTREQAVYLGHTGQSDVDAQRPPTVEGPEILAPGIHVLCNGLKSDLWHKSERIRTRFERELLPVLQEETVDDKPVIVQADNIESLAWQILEDSRQLDDTQLPDTGISLEWERLLSSIYIQHEGRGYGTRSANLLMLGASGIRFTEKIQHGPERGTVRRYTTT
ncbi:MAG: NRDE family protein [Lautropia sp.]|nr:NRDE family protein [Lautropia sp.]